MSAQTLSRVNTFLGTYYARQPISSNLVLEAGGGSFSHFDLPENSRLIALDLSHAQLMHNEATTLRVQGDLHELPFGTERLGMVVCFNVIEHLDHPEKALEDLLNALCNGGIMVLGCPNRRSLKGLVTWWTPTWVHRVYYRFIVGKIDRGEGHYDVFHTPFRRVVSAKSLPDFLRSRGMDVLICHAYDGAKEYGLVNGDSWKTRLVALPYYGLASLIRWLTFGAYGGTDSDILLVARK